MVSLPLDNLQIQLICEVDEMLSFVGNQKKQRWLWFAWEPRFKRIIAHAFLLVCALNCTEFPGD
ncbi:hypothetical protein CIT292_10994 [Citrobacter youngae ATCC 29220]|uniref:Transposase n=1 Tax=Citrobacter youngae ATCC 29220 TaxID=500640 RepID=D4BKB7_9ENTR|nr:hypothetical protein CIT292_10994 [Citrobacter youngae ATCC 29220]